MGSVKTNENPVNLSLKERKKETNKNTRGVGETGDNCNTGHVVTGDPTPRENDFRWLF